MKLFFWIDIYTDLSQDESVFFFGRDWFAEDAEYAEERWVVFIVWTWLIRRGRRIRRRTLSYFYRVDVIDSPRTPNTPIFTDSLFYVLIKFGVFRRNRRPRRSYHEKTIIDSISFLICNHGCLYFVWIIYFFDHKTYLIWFYTKN